MDGSINGPKICEGSTIIGTLEDKVATREGGLVRQLVNEEFDFIKNTNMVLLVLDLEVAVTGSGIDHVNDVLSVDKLGKLFIRGSTSPGAGVEHILGHNLVV